MGDPNRIECTICGDIAVPYKRAGCAHEYCVLCLRYYIEDKIYDFSQVIPKCPDKDCTNKFTVEEVSRIVPEQLDKFVYIVELNRFEVSDRLYCPHPDCKGIYSRKEVIDSAAMEGVSDKKIECDICQNSFCRICKSKWHDGPCEDDDTLLDQVHEIVGKPCPGCTNAICKMDDTCNHIICACGTHFCYLCLRLYDLFFVDGVLKFYKACDCGVFNDGEEGFDDDRFED